MIDYSRFIHPLDQKALAALKALPGFDTVAKKLIAILDEKQFKIMATSSFLQLGPQQLPEIYAILVRVCQKLQIDIPELYLELDREPNAYTTGDTDIFIVVTSGLLETMTTEQIETVIAHECGHIVCHHVLYSSMASLLLSGAELFNNNLISGTILIAIQYAFSYWKRCSELSADRISAYYQGGPDAVVDVMMALSGATANLHLSPSRDRFLKQAQAYKTMVENSDYNKVLEFLMYGKHSHPLNAYRAYEICRFCNEPGWAESAVAVPDNLCVEAAASDQDAPTAVLRICYEYIKGKGGLSQLRANALRVQIGQQSWQISKNMIKDLPLPIGVYHIDFAVGEAATAFDLTLLTDAALTVRWDASAEQLTVAMD